MFTICKAAKPFIKWVGGKGQLLLQLKRNLPQELYDDAFTYIEPFVGGGAMLFFMLQHFPNIKRVVINDRNENLANAYRNIKDHADELVNRLKHIEHATWPSRQRMRGKSTTSKYAATLTRMHLRVSRRPLCLSF